MSSFTKPLCLRFLDKPLSDKPFMLITPFKFYYGQNNEKEINVPTGYRTDFASVPRLFHRVVNPIGRHGKAAVVHDWLCDESPKRMDYKEAAEVFGEAMRVLGVSRWKRWAMVNAVKIAGPKFRKGDK